MITYVILFVFLLILAIEYELQPFDNTTLLIFVAIILGLFAGLRGPDVSKDYSVYTRIFDYVFELQGYDAYLPTFEPGFAFIVVTFRKLFQYNYVQSIMIFFAFSSVFLKIFAFKKLSFNPFFVILFYYSSFFMLHEMTQIRIGFASAFFLIGLYYYFKGQKIILIAFILFASLFHYSAILYLLIFIIDSKHFNYIFYSIVIVISIGLGISKIPFLNFLGNINPADYSGKVGAYTELVEYGLADKINVFNTINLLNLGCCAFFLFFVIPKNKLEEGKLQLFIKFMIISIFLLSLLSGIPTLAFRVSELFGVTSIFVYASLNKYLPFGKFNLIITVLLAIIIFYINVIHGDLMKPYYFTHFK